MAGRDVVILHTVCGLCAEEIELLHAWREADDEAREALRAWVKGGTPMRAANHSE